MELSKSLNKNMIAWLVHITLHRVSDPFVHLESRGKNLRKNKWQVIIQIGQVLRDSTKANNCFLNDRE